MAVSAVAAVDGDVAVIVNGVGFAVVDTLISVVDEETSGSTGSRATGSLGVDILIGLALGMRVGFIDGGFVGWSNGLLPLLMLMLLSSVVAISVGGVGAVTAGTTDPVGGLGLLCTKSFPLPLFACLSLKYCRYVSLAHCVSAMQFMLLGHTPWA